MTFKHEYLEILITTKLEGDFPTLFNKASLQNIPLPTVKYSYEAFVITNTKGGKVVSDLKRSDSFNSTLDKKYTQLWRFWCQLTLKARGCTKNLKQLKLKLNL